MRLEPCPSCGGVLKYDIEKRKIVCRDCKKEFTCGGCCSEKDGANEN